MFLSFLAFSVNYLLILSASLSLVWRVFEPLLDSSLILSISSLRFIFSCSWIFFMLSCSFLMLAKSSLSFFSFFSHLLIFYSNYSFSTDSSSCVVLYFSSISLSLPFSSSLSLSYLWAISLFFVDISLTWSCCSASHFFSFLLNYSRSFSCCWFFSS